MEKKLIELTIKTLEDARRALLLVPNHKLNIKGYKDTFDMAQQIGVFIHKFEEEKAIAFEEGGMTMEELIDDFIKKLREKSSSTVTSVQIFVSCSNSEIIIDKRTPEELRHYGVSMRNLKGEWIV